MSVSHRKIRSRSQKIRLALSFALLIVVLAALWVSVRAVMARDELIGAVPLARTISATAIAADGTDISPDVAELQDRASSAASLTSDPIWRAAELVPFAGQNLTAFRQAASMIDEVASEALPPLVELAQTFTLDSFAPKDGAFDLAPLIAAAPSLSTASGVLASVDAQASTIDTTGTIPQISEAVDQLVGLVAETKSVVDSLDTAAALLPPMLGATEPRKYLLFSLSNAELRSTGGIPGAIAVVNVDNGKLTLGELSSAAGILKFDEEALMLTESEKTLFGDSLGRYMLDVTSTPEFSRTGEIAQAMWQQETGQLVDGIVALDPVALSYILRATGPVEAGAGITLTPDNAAKVLFSDVYSMFADPVEQDAFFGGVTAQIFSAMTNGAADAPTLVKALTEGATENRIHVWSARDDEQTRISTTRLAGTVPISSESHTAFGVYFNDSTGAKMDYYLSSAIGIASGVCRNDGRPNFEIQVKLKSDAPADAATGLPRYVTGGDPVYATGSGVDAGNIRTNIYVYAPAGSVPYSAQIDGTEYVFVASEDGDHSVAGITVELTPQQTSTVTMRFVGLAGAASAVELQHTPMVSPTVTSLDNALDCASLPSEGEQTGASALHLPGLNTQVAGS